MQNRRASVAILCLAIGLAGSVPAAAGPMAPAISLSSGEVANGQSFTVTGSGCPDASFDPTLTWLVHVQVGRAGDPTAVGEVHAPTGPPSTPLAFTLEGYPGRVDADVVPASDGAWTASLTLGATGFPALPGSDHPVTAVCYAREGIEAGSISYAGARFVVPGAGPGGPTTSTSILARTGDTTAVVGWTGLGAMLVGAAAVGASRRLSTRRR